MNFFKRTVSMALCFAIFLTCLQGLPAGAENAILYETDFDADDGHAVKTEGLNDMLISDGTLSVERSKGTNVNFPDVVKLYAHSDFKECEYGKISIEFSVKRSEQKKMSFELCDSNDKTIFSLNFQTLNTISASYRASDGEDMIDRVIFQNSVVNEYIPVRMVLNQVLGSVSLWIGDFDGAPLLDNVCYAQESGLFCYMKMTIRAQNYHKVSLDYFKIYKSEITDKDAVAMDDACLTYQSFGKEPQNSITADLNLPDMGDYGSQYEWSSSDTAVITNQGKVTRFEKEDRTVTLTVYVKRGSEKLTKSFEVTVLKYASNLLPSPLEYIVNDDMQGSSLSRQITVNSGNPVLKDGALTLNENDAFSYVLRSDRTSYSDMLAFEFSLNSSGTVIEFYDDTETVCFSLKSEDDSLKALVRSENNAKKIMDTPYWTEVKKGLFNRAITVAFDPVSGLFSLWYGDDMITDSRLGSADCSKIYKFQMRQISGKANLSAVKVFIPSMPSEASVSFDAASLSEEMITWQNPDEITQNLFFPKLGVCSSNIEWESSHENIISESGKVTLPETDTQVNVTATLQKGNAKEIKNFEFVVLASKPTEFAQVKNVILEDTFTDNTAAGNWALEPENGYAFVKKEKLFLSRTSDTSSAITEASLYFNEMKSFYKGIYGLEYTLSREGSATLFMRVMGRKDYLALNWLPDGTFLLYGDKNLPSDDDVSAKSQNIYGSDGKKILCQDKLKMRMLFDTENSTFSLWINDEQVAENLCSRFRNHGNLRYLRMYMSSGSRMTVNIDNIRFYESYPLSQDRIARDEEWLTNRVIEDESDPSVKFGYVSKTLNLPCVGYYGSEISWSSSEPAIISDDGVVNQNTEVKKVILTAEIKCGNHVCKKEFEIYVSPMAASDLEAVTNDLALLTCQALSPFDDPADGIKRSLSLPGDGMYKSKISWVSDRPDIITNLGRVIRPRAGEEDVAVTLTATVSCGNISESKKISYTVLADEPFVDPGFMSDEDFFGVYDSSNGKWINPGKLDYSCEGMEKIEEAVKAAESGGDYTAAKEELLHYFRDVRSNTANLSMGNRNTGWANMITDDFQHLQTSAYYRGDMSVGGEWDFYSASINTANLADTDKFAISIRARYNEDSYVEIARADSEDEAVRPRLEIMVNGVKKVFVATDDVIIRAGDYKSDNFKDEKYLKIRDYGEFLGNGLQQVYIKFNLSGLSADDVITDAKLVIYAHAGPDFVSEKRLLILYDPLTGWERDFATWDNMTGYVYSFNGQPDTRRWDNIEGSDNEYYAQHTRFYCWPAIAVEYQLTGDERYAYKSQRIVESFLSETGAFTSCGTNTGYDESGIRGAYPYSLAAILRIGNWLNSIPVLIKSEYATPDYCTALLKNMWDTGNFLTQYNTASGNWRQFELQGLMDMALRLPEFYDSHKGKNWYVYSVDELEQLLFTNTFEDGSYIESTEAYGIAAFNSYVDYKESMMSGGADVSEAYDKRLHELAYYQALLYATDGLGIQYGDSPLNYRDNSGLEKVYKWFDDKELEYITTYGESGTEPEWTSKTYPDSTITTMRASWSKNSPFLFTNVRGGGQHGHQDYNGIILHAYGRRLLNDAGYFTYDSTDPYRIYGVSTKGHNTLVINDQSQRGLYSTENPKNTTGTVHEFVTNKAFDFLSQSTPNYEYFDHRRTITFIKPNLFIVSDFVNPEDKTSANNYKQVWHMYPEAMMSTSVEDNTIRSNYATGANVIVASADGDSVILKEELGWCARRYQRVEEAPFAYFEKNASGSVYMDTVIMPSNNDTTAAIVAERLDSKSSASALKLNFVQNGSEFTGYFYLSYDGEGGTFGHYTTDAECAYVQTDGEGNVCAVMIKNGSYIKDNRSGTYIFYDMHAHTASYVDLKGDDIYITTDAKSFSDVKIKLFKNPSRVYVNEIANTYNVSTDYITDIGTGDLDGSENKETSNFNGVIGNASSKDTSGSSTAPATGNSGGENGSGVMPAVSDEAKSTFHDVENHWSKPYVDALYKIGVVDGYPDGYFYPDGYISRAEFVAIVIRAKGITPSNYQNTFSDVSSQDWYCDIIQAALNAGIISVDDVFRPNDYITREEIAKIISRVALSDDKTYEKISANDIYADANIISKWAVDHVEKVSAQGLMLGRDDGTFAPKANATRGEAAAVVSRMLGK